MPFVSALFHYRLLCILSFQSLFRPPHFLLSYLPPLLVFFCLIYFEKGIGKMATVLPSFTLPHSSFRNNACILHSKHDEEGYIYPNMYIYIYVLLHRHTKKIKPQWEESNDTVEKNNKNRGMKEKKKWIRKTQKKMKNLCVF